MRTLSLLALLLLAASVAASCSLARPAATPARSEPAGPPAAAVVIDVYKSPTCGCCGGWEAYMRGLGYEVRSHPTTDMTAFKDEHGVPAAARSCHTSLVDGYVVEGHVPAEAIADLLASRPQVDGIALPGMPAGSPGMAGVQEGPFVVQAISDGALSDFGEY